MEEWLTGTRQKILNKCKELKAKGLIKDVHTKNGDVLAVLAKENGELEKILAVTDTQFENLLKLTKGIADEPNDEKDNNDIHEETVIAINDLDTNHDE